jgi:transposase
VAQGVTGVIPDFKPQSCIKKKEKKKKDKRNIMFPWGLRRSKKQLRDGKAASEFSSVNETTRTEK